MSRNNKNGALRDSYPILAAFDGEKGYLTEEEAINASVNDRIKSVWPFLVRQVLSFHETLRVRERANFDPEDVLTEVWVELVESDGDWKPEKGRYLSFAGVITQNTLASIRDRSRTVHSPRNSTCRMKAYNARKENGTLSLESYNTSVAIARTASGTMSIACNSEGRDGLAYQSKDATFRAIRDPNAERPITLLLRKESSDEADGQLSAAIRDLPAKEANILGRNFGLWGTDPTPLLLIAWQERMPYSEVRKLRDSAVTRIRRALTRKPQA